MGSNREGGSVLCRAQTQLLAAICNSSQSACNAGVASLHFGQQVTSAWFLWSTKMPLAIQSSHKIVSLLAAVAITFTVHGSLLAGFNHLADQAQASTLANCNAATLPAVTVTPARG
jgi:hypothetical protein